MSDKKIVLEKNIKKNENAESINEIAENINENTENGSLENEITDGGVIEEVYAEPAPPKKKRGGLRGRNFKQGLYSSFVALFVVVIVILFNLFIGQLNLKVDLTKEDVYTLTDETRELADSLTDEIEIYYLVKDGSEYEVLKNVIDQYDKLPNIKSIWRDPELYPQFAAQYTNEELQGNDVIVVNKTSGASRFIPFTDMYITDYQVDYSSYNYEYKNTLDAEGQITSAIGYVTSGVHTKMYAVSSHGETPLGEDVAELVKKANVDIETLDVLTQSTIPEDCDILFLNGPVTDISADELTMYKEFLDNGGKAIFTVAYSEKEMPNYYELLAYYGVEATRGVILENSGNYMQYPTYLLEKFESVTDDISSEYTIDDYVVMPIATILKTMEASQLRGTLKLSDIVISTEGAYGKTNPESTVIDKEENDPEGPFSLVIQATDTYKDKSSKVVIYASPYMLSDEWTEYYECSNISLFIDSIDWMSEQQSITVPKRSLDGVYLEVPQKDATIWAAITVIIVPLGILVIGFVVWYVRRKR